jgi:hypothetical protein
VWNSESHPPSRLLGFILLNGLALQEMWAFGINRPISIAARSANSSLAEAVVSGIHTKVFRPSRMVCCASIVQAELDQGPAPKSDGDCVFGPNSSPNLVLKTSPLDDLVGRPGKVPENMRDPISY